MVALFIFASLAMAASVAAGEVPDLDGGEVTIPWADFREILEKLQAPDPAIEPDPPVDCTLGRGTLTGRLDEGRLELTADYPLSVLKRGWVLLPLVETDAPLADVRIDGRTAPVTDGNGWVLLVLRGPATHTLTLRFRSPAPKIPGPGAVSLDLPAAAGQVLTLEVGPKLSGVTVDGATMSQEADDRISAILTDDTLTVRYTVALEKREEIQETLPPKVLVENSTLVSIDEGFVRAIVQLAYEVRHAPVGEFTLTVPEGFDVADCTGTSLAGWKLDEESRRLTATVGFEVKGAYSLTVVLERSTPDESFSFPLPAVRAEGVEGGERVERERGFFAIQVTGGVEVTPEEAITGLQLVDAKELPAGLSSGATSPIVLSLKYLRHPFSADLKVVRHETQPVLGAAIDTTSYVVQVTDDGDCVTRAVYTVRNNRKQFLEVTLPESGAISLWSSFVAGKPVRPSKTREGKILLPLEKSSYVGSELGSFTVEIIYYSNLGASLRTAGMIPITLPEVDLPISRSMLTLFAPARYEYVRVGGSMREPYSPPGPWGPGTVFEGVERRALEMADEVMEAEAPYPKSAMKKEARSYVERDDYRPALEMQQAQAEQVFRKRIQAAQQMAQDGAGALPARFAVPEEGTSMRFRELITIGEASSLRLFYVSGKLHTALAVAALLVAAALAGFAGRLVGGASRGRRGRILFGLAVGAILVLVAAGAPVGYVVWGALIGLGARLARWAAIRIASKGTAG